VDKKVLAHGWRVSVLNFNLKRVKRVLLETCLLTYLPIYLLNYLPYFLFLLS
jgi:hypothetical protein